MPKKRETKGEHFIPNQLSQIIRTQSNLPKTTPWSEHMSAITLRRNTESDFYFRVCCEILKKKCYEIKK